MTKVIGILAKEFMKINIEKILYWTFFIFLLYVIFELIRKIIGGSLMFEELITTFIVINIGYSFYLSRHLARNMGSIKDSIHHIDKKISGHIEWHKGKDEK